MRYSLSLLLVGLVLVLVLPTCLAQEKELGDVQINSCIQLKQTCDNCTWVNITSLTFPNKTTYNVSWNMTKYGTTYLYDYCPHQLGEYTYDTLGDLDSIPVAQSVTFNVTTRGSQTSFKLLLLLLICAGFFLVVSLFGNTEFFLYVSGCLFVMAGLSSMIYGIGDLADVYTRAIAFVSIGTGVLLCVGSYETYGKSEESEDFTGYETDDED